MWKGAFMWRGIEEHKQPQGPPSTFSSAAAVGAAPLLPPAAAPPEDAEDFPPPAAAAAAAAAAASALSAALSRSRMGQMVSVWSLPVTSGGAYLCGHQGVDVMAGMRVKFSL